MTSDTDPVWAGYVPPRIDTTGPTPDQDRMPLFYLTTEDGEKEHTAPRRVSAPVAIRGIREIALRGPEAGAWLMLEDSLSKETLDVLTTCEHMRYEDAQMILTQLGRLYYGQARDMKDPGGK